MGWLLVLGVFSASAGNAEVLQKHLEEAERVYLQAREMESAVLSMLDREPEVLDGVLDQLVSVVGRVGSVEQRWKAAEGRARTDATVDLEAFADQVEGNLEKSKAIAASVSTAVLDVRLAEARSLIAAGSPANTAPLARAHTRLSETLNLLADVEDVMPSSPRDAIFRMGLEVTVSAGAWDPALQWATDCVALCLEDAARVEAHLVRAQVARERDRDKKAAASACLEARAVSADVKSVDGRCDAMLGRSWRK